MRIANSFQLPTWLEQADAVAALGVSAIIILVSLRLARQTIDALLDSAPQAVATQVQVSIEPVEGVTEVRRIRMRRTGNKLFADAVIAAPVPTPLNKHMNSLNE